MQRFTVFERQSCGYCHRAKELLSRKGYNLSWVDIQQEGITKADLEKTVGKPVLTVPQVFHGETHIGGFTELQEYIGTLEAAQNTRGIELLIAVSAQRCLNLNEAQ